MGDRLATIDMRQKVGGCCAPFRGWKLGAPFHGSSWVLIQHNVAGTEAYLHAKFHLIYPTVWPQYTNVTDRQTKVPYYRANRFTNGRPKNSAFVTLTQLHL